MVGSDEDPIDTGMLKHEVVNQEAHSLDAWLDKAGIALRDDVLIVPCVCNQAEHVAPVTICHVGTQLNDKGPAGVTDVQLRRQGWEYMSYPSL
jgi:hypothetical protein